MPMKNKICHPLKNCRQIPIFSHKRGKEKVCLQRLLQRMEILIVLCQDSELYKSQADIACRDNITGFIALCLHKLGIMLSK